MKLKSLGAVREVTGSMHLIVSEDNKKIILDCGMFQGRRKEAEEKNRQLSINPKELDAICVSHAHVDHCGRLPYFVKKGFKGPIFTTSATAGILKYILADSAYLQARDIEYVNKKRKPGEPLKEVLYSQEDVEETLSLLEIVNFGTEFKIAGNLRGNFYRAGHILGSAMIAVEENGVRLLFSGDLGRKNAPLLRDPEDLSGERFDYLIMESTYGGRVHHSFDEGRNRLKYAVNKAHENKGKLIIPAFSLGRTQEIVFSMNQLRSEGEIPRRMEFYVDSPLSTNVTEIFREHFYELDKETQKLMAKEGDPLGFGTLVYTKSVDESKALNLKRGTFVIISASGMCEGGRIVHHLKNSIENNNNIIMIVSFQAKHTLGRRIAEGNKEVRIFGKDYKVNAEILTNNEWSAHADSNELVNYALQVNPKKIFIVHGEEKQSEILKDKLDNQGFDAIIPEENSLFHLNRN